MTKCDPATTITKATLQAALRDARTGADYVRRDPACPGLELRVRYHKVAWTIRCRMARGGKQRRFDLGDGNVLPDEARRRGQKVKDLARQGLDPSAAIVEMKTGVSVKQQREEEARRGPASITWQAARRWFVHEWTKSKRSIDTFDTYRKNLENTPELAVFDDRMVSTITAEDVAEVLAKIAERDDSYSLAENVQRTLSSMWSRLADPSESRRTGVKPYAIRHAKAPQRPAPTLYAADGDEIEYLSMPPSKLQLGRAIAIAKTGAIGLRRSAAILLLAGSVQRRRTIVGANRRNFRDFDDEECWAIPPYFRKTAKKKRSKGVHVVPLVGWAATAQRTLARLAPADQNWLLPAGPTKGGKPPRTPHINARTLSRWMEDMPGVEFSPHPWRAAAATYGPEHLGWNANDAKTLLDHLEGFDGGDVTAQHYNTNPDILKKRRMLTEWLAFLDRCEAEAIAADSELADVERIGELFFIQRNGDVAHKRALRLAAKKKKKDGKLPWSGVERLVLTEPATVESLEVWRKRKMPA